MNIPTEWRVAVARALAPHMEGGREYDQMPADRIALRKWSRERMCSFNDATQDDAREAADAAILALLPLVVERCRATIVEHLRECCENATATRIETLAAQLEAQDDVVASLLDRLAAAEARNAKLVECLEWYADQMCEGFCDGDPKASAAIGSDNCAGCPARAALGEPHD